MLDYLAALPDEVKQIIADAFTLIAARTYTTRVGHKEMGKKRCMIISNHTNTWLMREGIEN